GLLEGHDAGERDVETERDGAAGELGPAGETVQDSVEGPLPHFLLKNARHVVIRVARVNDQWETGRARGRDVIAEAPLLRVTRAKVIMIVEACFADGDGLAMLGEAHDVLDADIELLMG